jgi:hypothetical protein
MSPVAKRFRRPASPSHFTRIQEWVLEYTNTLWEEDGSDVLLDHLLPTGPPRYSRRNLIFCGPDQYVVELGESIHRYMLREYESETFRAWSRPLTWSFGDMLCTRHMYNHSFPHLPYLRQHQLPVHDVVVRGELPLHFFLGRSWLFSIRAVLVESFTVYRLWLGAAQFFHLDVSDLQVLEPGTYSGIAKDLVEASEGDVLPISAGESFIRQTARREVMRIENTAAEAQGLARLLMHRTIDHIASVAGLEPPHFGVDHTLVGAFISMDDADVPIEELERHGIPLHGIRILEPCEVRPLNPFTISQDFDQNSRDIANEVAKHSVHEERGSFVEIWKMKRAPEVKHPSPWHIRALPSVHEQVDVHLQTVYKVLFKFGLQDVDSAMAGALCNVLGPDSVSLRDVVPRPPLASSTPPPPDTIDADVDVDVGTGIDPANLPPEASGIDDFLSDEESEDEDALAKQRRRLKRKEYVHSMMLKDPLWESVSVALPMALLAPGDARDFIVPIVRVAESKEKTRRTPLEEYVLEKWSTEKKGSEPLPKGSQHVRERAHKNINRGMVFSGFTGERKCIDDFLSTRVCQASHRSCSSSW